MQDVTCLQDNLRRSAGRAPDHAVFVRGSTVTTYAELETAARSIARGLEERGVAPGDRVALVLDGSVEYLMTYYAVLILGAVIVPLCPDTRTAILVDSLTHAGARALVTTGRTAQLLVGQSERVPELGCVVTLGGPEFAPEGALRSDTFDTLLTSEPLPHREVAPDSLASIVYTSGSTGAPKGVMLSHRNLVTNVRSIVSSLGLGRDDRVAMVLPYFYVYGNSVLHTHVAAGATIVAAGSMAFPAAVLKVIEEQRCTGFSGVPSTFAHLLRFKALDGFDLGSLRTVTQAGAAMTAEMTDVLRARLPRAAIYVMYGQTEAAARLAVVPPERLDDKRGSAGRAIDGVELKICDAAGRELPRSTVGEVVARGENVMLGYWKDEAATARVLRPEGLRTGDLGSIDDEGFLFLVGRQSEMIKSGGHRISPRKIEEVVESCPSVEECGVVGVPDELLGQRIVACVVTRGDGVDADRVLLHCSQFLPRFSMPAKVVFLDRLPKTETGKLKRLALLGQVEAAPA